MAGKTPLTSFMKDAGVRPNAIAAIRQRALEEKWDIEKLVGATEDEINFVFCILDHSYYYQNEKKYYGGGKNGSTK